MTGKPMKVNVQLFAVARQLAGCSEVEVEIANGATIAQLREALEQQVPSLKEVLAHALFAIDSEYAGDKTPIGKHSEIAVIPPVSGG